MIDHPLFLDEPLRDNVPIGCHTNFIHTTCPLLEKEVE